MAAAVPAEVRIYMAKVAEAYEAEGVSYKRQREIYSEAGYEISEPTFRRLRACMHEGSTHCLEPRARAVRKR